MAPFVHCSTGRPGRFTDGSYGLYYAGDSEEVAVAETIHHHQKFMSSTPQRPGWTSDFRVLVGSVDRELDDVNAVLAPCIRTITPLPRLRDANFMQRAAMVSCGTAFECPVNVVSAFSGRTP